MDSLPVRPCSGFSAGSLWQCRLRLYCNGTGNCLDTDHADQYEHVIDPCHIIADHQYKHVSIETYSASAGHSHARYK
ncbi:hypothetical protein ccbrp13_12060 [Ktedonobacteria bacterium brp13]|nr:hypothetical protein ccbrp13_12060 [Ktedonobacteria bacterium brp13]